MTLYHNLLYNILVCSSWSHGSNRWSPGYLTYLFKWIFFSIESLIFQKIYFRSLPLDEIRYFSHVILFVWDELFFFLIFICVIVMWFQFRLKKNSTKISSSWAYKSQSRTAPQLKSPATHRCLGANPSEIYWKLTLLCDLYRRLY